MKGIHISPVRTRGEQRIFLTFPWQIYHNDSVWVPPLLPNWKERLDPQKGVFFKRGTAECFIAWKDGKPVGTICAAEDREMNAERGLKECLFGFFNFIEDYGVFETLLECAGDWARARSLKALTGPFNLDYEDSYGVLVEGRERPAAMLCGHSPAYYLPFYEQYGFEPMRGDNIAFALDLTHKTQALDDLAHMAERVRGRKQFTIRPGDMAHWEEEMDRIYILLNTCMRHLPDYRPWPRDVVFSSLAPFRKVADPELILFAEQEGKTIGFLPGLPNLNEAFIHANGLRNPWDYLRLLWWMRHQPQCLTVKTVLVLPEYWGSGAIILLLDKMVRQARAKGYLWIDGSLTSEDNPRTPALGARFGARIYKRYRVFRKFL